MASIQATSENLGQNLQMRDFFLLFRQWWCLLAMLVLVGCANSPKVRTSTITPESASTNAAPPPISPTVTPNTNQPALRMTPALPAAGSGRGAYYQDDGPGEQPPDNLLALPEPEPKVEPYSKTGNRPYKVFGKLYTPITDDKPFSQRGIGSWYGKKFHGQKTSSGELYDMYKLTAAHPTLPIPSYARVSNLRNGKQVIVRINDRGPFHSSRVIDLSYTAALKLGYLASGSSELLVERLLPDDIARLAQSTKLAQQSQSPQVPAKVIESSLQSTDLPSTSAPRDIVLLMQSDQISEQTFAGHSTSAAVRDSTPAPSLEAQPKNSLNGKTVNSNASEVFYLQLSAFEQASNAESAQQRLAQNWPANLPPLRISFSGNLHRLYCGPYSGRLEASKAARWLQDGGWLQSAPLVIPLSAAVE